MGKTQLEESEATDKQISSNTKCNSNQIEVKTNERPEWLPEGWNVDFRTRKSGPNMGHGYKCYINPLGKKFYSKLEVFRYLESIKGNSCTSKMEDCKSMHSPSNDVGEKSKIEKFTAKKSMIGKPIAEKPSVDKPTAKKPSVDKPTAKKPSVDKLTPDKSTDVDLPPDWIKEVNIRKSGNSNKRDVFYTDPVSGYVFRSKKDALRYIESGDINSCATKPNKRQIQVEDKSAPTSTPGKKQKKKQSATKRQLFSGESGLLENGVANPLKKQKTSDPDDVQENLSNHSLSKKALAQRSSKRLSGVDPVQLTNNLNNEQTLPVPKKNLRKGRTALDTDLPTKSYQLLNGVPETEKVKDNKPDNPHNSQGLASEDCVLNKNKLHKSIKSKAKVNADMHHSAVELVELASINGESSNKSRKSSRIPPGTNGQLEKHENINDETLEPQQSFAFHYSWSDPSLEFAINTLTGTLPVEDPVLKSPTVISKTDKFPENNLSENVTGSSKDKKPKVNSSNSKNRKKELKMPTRLSKRLSGHEPDLLPAERALEYSTRKSCKDKSNANPILISGESAHIHAEESKLMAHASDKLKAKECGESVPNEKLQRLEAEITNDEKSERQFPLQFGNSWSDPRIEFAMKTLTGSLPADAAAPVNLPVVTPDANPPNMEMPENMAQKSNEAVHDNSNHCQTKEEPDTVCQQSKQLLDQPELKTSSPSYEKDPIFATQESCSVEGNITMNLDGGQSLRTEGGNVTQIDINTLFFDDPFMEDEQFLGDESVTEQPQPETETTNQDTSERVFCASFMDSWSDPCLAFAYKTLTGPLPEEENIAMQGSSQEPANIHEQKNESSTLQEIGSSSIYQGDKVEKSMPGQQAPMNSNVCTEADTPKHYSQWNNNDNSFQRR